MWASRVRVTSYIEWPNKVVFITAQNWSATSFGMLVTQDQLMRTWDQFWSGPCSIYSANSWSRLASCRGHSGSGSSAVGLEVRSGSERDFKLILFFQLHHHPGSVPHTGTYPGFINWSVPIETSWNSARQHLIQVSEHPVLTLQSWFWSRTFTSETWFFMGLNDSNRGSQPVSAATSPPGTITHAGC